MISQFRLGLRPLGATLGFSSLIYVVVSSPSHVFLAKVFFKCMFEILNKFDYGVYGSDPQK